MAAGCMKRTSKEPFMIRRNEVGVNGGVLPIVAAIIAGRAPIGAAVGVFLDHHGGRRRLHDHRLRLRDRWGFLHDGNYALADALLLKRDDVLGLERSGDAVSADVIEDEFLIDAAAGHVDDVGDGCGIGRNGASVLLSDHGLVSGVLFIECAADGCPANGTDSCADGGAGQRIVHCAADGGSGAGPQQAAKKRALV
jgi:hypothetical protein